MKITLLVSSFFLIFVSHPVFATTEILCKACNIIEKEGDDSLEALKKMDLSELSKSYESGETPFYWSIRLNAKKVRDFLVQTLKKEELISADVAAELYGSCAFEEFCPEENLDLLKKLGFPIGKGALAGAVTGTQVCSLEKFKKLVDIGAPFDGKDKKGYNLLHQIADRSRQGRPIFSRDCLVSAIQITVAKHPELKKQKNKEGLTPFQLASQYSKDKTQWGSAITAAHLKPIVAALR